MDSSVFRDLEASAKTAEPHENGADTSVLCCRARTQKDLLLSSAKQVPWMVETLNLPRDVILRVITSYPDLLNLSTEKNLGPTIQFFYDEMGASREEVSEVVARGGKALLYSLEKRWKPRVARIRAKGVTPCFHDHWKPIANRSPAKFDEWLATLQ